MSCHCGEDNCEARANRGGVSNRRIFTINADGAGGRVLTPGREQSQMWEICARTVLRCRSDFDSAVVSAVIAAFTTYERSLNKYPLPSYEPMFMRL